MSFNKRNIIFIIIMNHILYSRSNRLSSSRPYQNANPQSLSYAPKSQAGSRYTRRLQPRVSPNAIARPNNANAIARPNANAIARPNANAIARPNNANAIARPNANAIARPNNANAIARPNANARARPNANAKATSQAIVKREQSANYGKTLCVICQEPLKKRNLTILKCGHLFCASCIFKCLKYTRKCPLCRDEIVENLYRTLDDSTSKMLVSEVLKDEPYYEIIYRLHELFKDSKEDLSENTLEFKLKFAEVLTDILGTFGMNLCQYIHLNYER